MKKKLLKDEKNKRNQIEKEKEQAIDSIAPLKETIEDLEKELNEKERELEIFSKDSDMLRNLFERGVIDIDGNPL